MNTKCPSCRHKKNIKAVSGRRYYDCNKYQFIDNPVCPKYQWWGYEVVIRGLQVGIVVLAVYLWINTP